MSKTFSPSSENDNLNLQPGEWVQVRSIDDISTTLDGERQYKGLYFIPEMEKFCGEKYKVFKKVQIIKLESTGEVRRLRSPTVFLEGVYCKGDIIKDATDLVFISGERHGLKGQINEWLREKRLKLKKV